MKRSDVEEVLRKHFDPKQSELSVDILNPTRQCQCPKPEPCADLILDLLALPCEHVRWAFDHPTPSRETVEKILERYGIQHFLHYNNCNIVEDLMAWATGQKQKCEKCGQSLPH